MLVCANFTVLQEMLVVLGLQDVKTLKLPIVLSALFLLYLFQALINPKGADIAFGLIMLVGLFSFKQWYLKWRKTSFSERFLIFAFAFFTVVSIISFFYWPYSREARMRLEDYGFFLFFMPLFFLLRNYRFKALYLVIALGLLACVLGLMSITQYVSMKYFGEYIFTGEHKMAEFWMRPSGGVNPIRYAAISLILVCFAVNAKLLIRNKGIWVDVLLIAAIALALVACVLAQTRGTWLAFPVLVFLYCWYLFKTGSKRFVLIFILVGGVVVTSLSQTHFFKQRMALSGYSFERYSEGYSQTSIGARLDMFKAAVILIKQNPIWGHGLNSYKEKATEIRKAIKGMSSHVGMWNNPHNEILQVMVEKGIIGLISLILLFAAPAYLFIKGLYVNNVVVKYFALNGLAILVVYAVAGQSVALFEHNLFNHFYIVMVLLFASQVVSYQRGDKAKDVF